MFIYKILNIHIKIEKKTNNIIYYLLKMFPSMLKTINADTHELILMLGFLIIQSNNIILNIFGYIIITIISYIEIKKRNIEKKKQYINSILYISNKKDYAIYNSIIECINNKEYQRIDIMKAYKDLLEKVNTVEYDFDKQNNCLDLFCILAFLDNVFYSNKKITKSFIENGQDILDIYARLVNIFHNISISAKYNDIFLIKELDELYSKYNYNNYLKPKITEFCYKNNIYQLY